MKVYTFIVIWSVLTISFSTYMHRYALGLVKPSFKVGDCVDWDLSNEFHEQHVQLKVVEVGKKSYHLQVVSGNEAGGDTAVDFEKAETVYKKITCPVLTFEDVGE